MPMTSQGAKNVEKERQTMQLTSMYVYIPKDWMSSWMALPSVSISSLREIRCSRCLSKDKNWSRALRFTALYFFNCGDSRLKIGDNCELNHASLGFSQASLNEKNKEKDKHSHNAKHQQSLPVR